MTVKPCLPKRGFGCLRRPEVGIGRQTAPVSHASCCDLKRDDRNNSIFAIDDDHLVADHEVAAAAPLHEGRRDRNDAHVLDTAVPTLMEKLTLLARGPVSLILVRCSVVSVAPLPPVCPC